MEVLAVLFALGVVAVGVLIPVLAIVALVRVNEQQRLARSLEGRIAALERGSAAADTGPPFSAAEPSEPARAAATPPRPAPTPPQPATVRAPAPVRRRAGPAPDFATQLGPRILVATGALAFVVFLALFVRYAWENQWVGPAGRVTLGAITGLALVAAGLRLLRSELRPLGQGLAAAGLASLYVSAFAAHGLYALVPRGAAGLAMLAITACAVLLADRLEARLFAAVGWVGAYLTPALLATGEDLAVALFAYLALLNAGALLLDHRRPWPETLPLAVAGTVVLSLSWYARHFAPDRFDVAALALVVFTAEFGLGAARKQRTRASAVVLLGSALAVAFLAGGADRPLALALLSLLLAAAGLHMASRLGGILAFVAGVAVALPLFVWVASHYEPASFGAAALWIAGGGALFAAFRPPRLGPLPVEAGAVVFGGLAVVPLVGASDRPLLLLGLLLAQALVATFVRPRWRWAEAAGVLTGGLAVTVWLGEYYRPGREEEALSLVLVLAGAWLLLLLGHGLLTRRIAGWPDVVGHLATAALAWYGLDVVLDEGPWLGAALAALAALYLALGLVAVRIPAAGPRQHQTFLGLAAAFLTLVIPVQLGLHGITLGWALEGALLLALGTRFPSKLARAGGYAVLGAAVVRLLGTHLPLHPGLDFRPVFNPAFGTWLIVVAVLAGAWWLAAPARRAGRALDRRLGPVLASLALLLLLGLLTGETHDSFAQQARLAREASLAEAARDAVFSGQLAVSALWASFATALLGGGLAARHRPLFYAGYALFALTAAKLLLFDLASLQTLYRMLSFLVLGLLLLAGAWLNLRFRERLLPAGDP